MCPLPDVLADGKNVMTSPPCSVRSASDQIDLTMKRKSTRLIYISFVLALIAGAVLLRYADPFFVRALRLIAFDIFSASILRPTTPIYRSALSTLMKNRCRSSASGHGREQRCAIY